MQTETVNIPIQVPQGFQVKLGDASIIVTEQPKDVKERFKTVDDVLKEHAFTKESFDQQFGNMEEDEKAYIILKMLAQSLNEGWKPNWNDTNESKYYPWFWMNGGSSGFRYDGYDRRNSNSDVGSRLCFKSSSLAEYAGKQFLHVYKQFMIIN